MTDFRVGQKVQTMHDWPGIPKYTEGVVIHDYGTGITVGWDLPDRPFPTDRSILQVAMMKTHDPECPLADGFNKEKELHYLVRVGKPMDPHLPAEFNRGGTVVAKPEYKRDVDLIGKVVQQALNNDESKNVVETPKGPPDLEYLPVPRYVLDANGKARITAWKWNHPGTPLFYNDRPAGVLRGPTQFLEIKTSNRYYMKFRKTVATGKIQLIICDRMDPGESLTQI